MIADPVPDQSQGRVAHSSGHTPHLTIHALGDLQLQPTVRHGLAHPDGGITLPHRGLGDASDLGRPRHPPLHHDPATKPRKGRIIGEPLDLNPVGLGFAELGMGELMLQLTVIGEQQEPFAIGIESTAGINARSFDEVRQGGALPVTRKLAENSVGLVECDQQRFSSCRRGQAGSPERMTPALPWPHPILLAPLTKGGNLPYRRLCVDFGAKVTCSEMAYSHKLLKGSGRELALLRHHESEAFFGVQIATHKPELAAESAVLAVEHGAKWVDLNCGCPIDDTVKRGMGARLMDRPKVLVESVAAMVRAVDVPVTAKLRLGFRKGKVKSDRIAEELEGVGAAAVILHGRSREQRYSRSADWDAVGRLVQDRSLPIAGNGDVLTWYEAKAKLEQSGAHALMLARGALIKPWIFQEIEEQRELCLSPEERIGIYHRLAGYFREHFGSDEMGHRRTMQFLPWHFSFFSRYAHLPEATWGASAAEHPLLQTRDAAARPQTPIERLLATGNFDRHQEIATVLWNASSADEAVERMVQLAEARAADGGLDELRGRMDTRGWG